MAMLHLLAPWARTRGVALSVATVDHGLRAEAAGEARLVAAACARLGLPHETLRWQGWSGQGNLQDQARRARRRLLGEWARTRGIGAVALAHTRDDQAETFLMRLARGSGVDGLAAMRPTSRGEGIVWLRPLLEIGRGELRALLRAQGIPWAEDPSNRDLRFDRIKARRMLDTLAPLGLSREGLAATAGRMRMACAALADLALRAARKAARVEAGDVLLDLSALAAFPEETRLRLFAHSICWVAGAGYRPRLAALGAALEDVMSGRRRSLHGTLICAADGQIRITREYRAVAGLRCPVGALWDNRWRLIPAEGGKTSGNRGLEVAALGAEGLARCPDWRHAGLPRASLLASPAVWRGDELIAAPLAERESAWHAKPAGGSDHYYSTILSH